MSDRVVTKLTGKIQIKHGFPFKSEHFSEAGEYVILTPGNFYEEGGFKRNAEKDKFYTASFPPEYLLKKGDLVVAMTEQAEGLLGSMAIVPEDEKFLHNQRLGLVTSRSPDVDLHFLYYLFQTKSIRLQVRRSATGSKVKHTSPDRLYDVVASLPQPETQKRIAKVLSTLDAKIDLNRRLNAELEAMAKLLYDYWFVQFDFLISAAQAAAMGRPDLEGKPYRASGGKMVYNAELKREIPEGWRAGAAADLLHFNPSTSLKKGLVAGYFDMDAVPTSGFMTKPAQRKEFSGGTKFLNGDVVVARITPCLENGKTALITQLNDGEVGFGSTEFIVLRGKARPLSSFTACLARSKQFRSFAILNMTGTSGRKRIDAPVLAKFPLPIPPDDLLESYERIVQPMFNLMNQHEKQSHELTQLRDWLLPMLMNGQVAVGDPAATQPGAVHTPTG